MHTEVGSYGSMVEGSIIDISLMSDQSRCSFCKASNGVKCLVANLEYQLRKIPTRTEVELVGVNMSNIPTDCPNGYKAQARFQRI